MEGCAEGYGGVQRGTEAVQRGTGGTGGAEGCMEGCAEE